MTENEMTTEMPTSPKRLARIAGVLYLGVGITGGFAEGFVEPRMYVAGNAAATAGNVVANSGLVRMAVVAELLDYIFFVFLVMALYILLQHVHKSVARAMLVFVALAAGIVSLNTVFLFEGLQVATDSSYEAAFGTAGSNALVLLLLDLQHYGLLIGQVYFGLWLVPLGYLAYRSGMFPKALGVVLIVAGVCYLVDLFAAGPATIAVDASPENRPGVPREAEPRPDEGAHWVLPPRQQPTVRVFRRRGLEELTPVFGTAQPPHGVSGLLRWLAYRAPEHRARH
jgi:hypothetical protein